MDTVTGVELALPFVAEIGSTRSHVARSVTWHTHDGIQILFLQRGTTAYEFARRDKPEVVLPGGHLLAVPGSVPHRGAPDMRPPCILFHIVLKGWRGPAWDRSPFTTPERVWLQRQFAGHPLEPRAFSRSIHRLVEELVRGVAEFRTSRGKVPPLRARMRLQLCELLLESAAQLNEATQSEPDDLVAAAEAWIRGHLAEKIHMDTLARAVGVTRARLFEQFKRSAGLTPNDFLLRLRVDKARELMADSRHSLTDIALNAGFSTSQYFSTVFRRYTGRTPKAYREGLLRGAR